MQRSTTSRSQSAHLLGPVPAALAFVAALALFAPGRASADSPAAIRSASAAVTAVQASLGVHAIANPSILRPAPKPVSMGFISEDLLNTATELVQHGVRVGNGLAGGTVYVHFKPQGFGGVLSIRYRR